MIDHFLFKSKYPFIKKVVNFFFWLFIFLIFFFFLDVGRGPDPKFFSFMAFVSVLALLVPIFISRWGKLGKIYNKDFIYTIEFLVVVCLIFGWLGARGGVGLFWIGVGYDSLDHFAVSGLIAICLFFLSFHLFENYWKNKNKFFPLLGVFFATMFIGVFNEFFELYGDKLMGTEMYGEAGDPFDTIKDLIYDVLGVLVAIVICYIKGEEWINKFKLKKEKKRWRERLKIKRKR